MIAQVDFPGKRSAQVGSFADGKAADAGGEEDTQSQAGELESLFRWEAAVVQLKLKCECVWDG